MKKVLVVDDEPVLRMLITDTLEEMGFAIMEAADGEEAISAINEHHFDLVILDYMMPKFSGLEVLKEVNAINKTYPFIMLTAKASDKDKKIALESGATHFMSKPFSPIELMNLVEELIV